MVHLADAGYALTSASSHRFSSGDSVHAQEVTDSIDPVTATPSGQTKALNCE